MTIIIDHGFVADYVDYRCGVEVNGKPCWKQRTDHAFIGFYPDILMGTEIFMRKARQLEAPPAFDNEFGSIPLDAIRKLRYDLLEEEWVEYHDAEHANDKVEIIDGLLDIIVIAWGSLLAYVGPDKAKAAAHEVVRSNLAKVMGEGLPYFREDGKVIKPPNWTPPDIAGVL